MPIEIPAVASKWDASSPHDPEPVNVNNVPRLVCTTSKGTDSNQTTQATVSCQNNIEPQGGKARDDHKGKCAPVPVTLCIEWPSKKKEKRLPEELSSLGKMLCRGTYEQIANAAWRNKFLRGHLLKEMAKEINKECSGMCSTKNPSCLRKSDPESIVKFSFNKLHEEQEKRTPIFRLLLMSASLSSRKGDSDDLWKTSVCVAASVCLRNRSQQLNAFQLMLSVVLQHSGFMV